MWISGIIILIGGLLTVFAVPRIKDDDHRAGTQFIVLLLVTLGVSIVLTSHPEPITNIIKAYQKGQIVKYETIIVEGTDTVKIIKYKYK